MLNTLKGDKLRPTMIEALLVLIPKKDMLGNIMQFHPISICNVSFKVLVNRLKIIMEKVVSLSQSSFIPRLHIKDNIIICQAMIHTLKNKTERSRGIIIKIDLEKVYNCLEWHFIKKMRMISGYLR